MGDVYRAADQACTRHVERSRSCDEAPRIQAWEAWPKRPRCRLVSLVKREHPINAKQREQRSVDAALCAATPSFPMETGCGSNGDGAGCQHQCIPTVAAESRN